MILRVFGPTLRVVVAGKLLAWCSLLTLSGHGWPGSLPTLAAKKLTELYSAVSKSVRGGGRPTPLSGVSCGGR
jgi:hypothetical protein